MAPILEGLIGWELLFALSGLYLLAIFVLVILPACFGTSIGVRYLYMRILHNVFDFGRRKIESRQLSGNSIPPNGFIEKSDEPWSPPKSPGLPKNRSFGTFHKEFHMEDLLEFLKCGSEAIIDDEVTKRFGTAELASWNLLTRTNEGYAYISFRLTVVWVFGFFFRYFILLPVRLSLAVIGISFLFFATFILARFPETPTRKWLDNKCMLVAFRIMARALSVIVTYHNREYKGKGGGICVANHTSPIDAVILANDNCYSLVGQAQPGVMGFVQKALARTQDHIWFERTEMKDRQTVTKRLREHVEDPSKNPILIFPEGTCINNTSVMMFKKGSFEIGGKIYPAAIKYDPTFSNAFWNSSQETMGQYLISLMTSWATVCDVWYMPPQEKLEDESAVEFANRVKREIARQGGLVDLIWDGQLKRFKVKPEFKQRNQEDYALRFKID